MSRSIRSVLVSLVAVTAMALTTAPAVATHGDLAGERKACRTFGKPRPGSVLYAGPSNLGVYCKARRDGQRYGVIGYHSRPKAKRGARVICRWYSAGVVRKGKTVVVSPERGHYRMRWLARRLDGVVVCNG
jgi:hypothetical protein